MYRLLTVFVLIFGLAGCSITGGPAPVYGCWCGKNQPPDGEHPAPVDVWDDACRHHDLCYRYSGRDHPQCDITFIRRIEALAIQFGYIPGQMQAAHSYFGSRLYGRTYVQAWFTPHDVEGYISAGHACN